MFSCCLKGFLCFKKCLWFSSLWCPLLNFPLSYMSVLHKTYFCLQLTFSNSSSLYCALFTFLTPVPVHCGWKKSESFLFVFPPGLHIPCIFLKSHFLCFSFLLLVCYLERLMIALRKAKLTCFIPDHTDLQQPTVFSIVSICMVEKCSKQHHTFYICRLKQDHSC